jgi:hypothetical protein
MLRTVQFLPPAPPDSIKEPAAEAMQNAPMGYVLFLSLWACCQRRMRETDMFLTLHRSWFDSIKATVRCAQLRQRFWAVRCPNRFSICAFLRLRECACVACHLYPKARRSIPDRLHFNTTGNSHCRGHIGRLLTLGGAGSDQIIRRSNGNCTVFAFDAFNARAKCRPV